MVDLDGNGKPDLISGSWPGQVYVFGARSKRGFQGKKTALTDKAGQAIKPGNASTVFAVDWDRDGDLDLLAGNIDGELMWYPNLSGGKQLILGKKTLLVAGGKPLKRVGGGDSAPVAADWDGDGDLDLLAGGANGDVLLFRNVSPKGTKGPPTLAPAKRLLKGGGWQGAADGHGCRTKVCVVDHDGDGRLDLLVGDFHSKGGEYHGYVWFYKRKAPASGKTADAAAREF